MERMQVPDVVTSGAVRHVADERTAPSIPQHRLGLAAQLRRQFARPEASTGRFSRSRQVQPDFLEFEFQEWQFTYFRTASRIRDCLGTRSLPNIEDMVAAGVKEMEMTALRRGNRRFWLELLELGDSEEERRRNSYVCCAWKICPSRESCIPDEHWNRFLERADVGVISDEEKDRINSLANSFGVHQMRLPRPSITFIPFMDFTGFEFANNMSFSGRVLF